MVEDFRASGSIQLDINRGSNSSKKCVFPNCTHKRDLHSVPNILRQNVLKLRRYYIPTTAKVCANHSNFVYWSDARIPTSNFPFTTTQITEMVDLLRISLKQRDIFAGSYLSFVIFLLLALFNKMTLIFTSHKQQIRFRSQTKHCFNACSICGFVSKFTITKERIQR